MHHAGVTTTMSEDTAYEKSNLETSRKDNVETCNGWETCVTAYPLDDMSVCLLV